MKNEESIKPGWLLFLGGLCMGAADLVPGISGGTIAFILGFYSSLLKSLKTLNGAALQQLVKGQWRQLSKTVEWKFLAVLGSGILCAMVILVHPFYFILNHPQLRIYLYATFFGLVIASFYFCIRQLSAWTMRTLVVFLVGACVSYTLTGTTLKTSFEEEYNVQIIQNHPVFISAKQPVPFMLNSVSKADLGVLLKQQWITPDAQVYNAQGNSIGKASDLAEKQNFHWLDLKMIGSGALAICALLLPGISGSYILTLLGVYPVVIGAFADFVSSISHLSFDADAFRILLNLGLGIGIGVLSFARLLSFLMKHYADLTLSLLSGFMIGALRSVWPFWSQELSWLPLKLGKGPQLLPMAPIWPQDNPKIVMAALLCSLLGFSLVWMFEKIAAKRARFKSVTI